MTARTKRPAGPDEGPPAGRATRRVSFVESHRATTGGWRPMERLGVLSYRAARVLLNHVPAPVAWTVLGALSQVSYRVWPAKRRWVNVNFSHVLGLPPEHPEVRRLALRAYRNYARYLVELMRLPSMPLEKISARVESDGIDSLKELWRESGGLILVAAHVGNQEFIVGGMKEHGLPLNVLGDDTAFPEMFELLQRERLKWGVRIVPWRNLREVFTILKRGEMLGLLVDWGYRSDGIPVRLFGAWTTLPAGPAVLAGKTGTTIVPIVSYRRPDGTFFVTHEPPIRVASAGDADVQHATQEVADALERIIAAAPDQWYSFKPIWPVSDEERTALAHLRNARLDGTEAVEGAG